MIYIDCAKDEETGLYVTPDGEILKPIKQVARSQRPKAYGFHWEVVNR